VKLISCEDFYKNQYVSGEWGIPEQVINGLLQHTWLQSGFISQKRITTPMNQAVYRELSATTPVYPGVGWPLLVVKRADRHGS